MVRRDILGAIVRMIADEGRTVLVSSHLLAELAQAVDSFIAWSEHAGRSDARMQLPQHGTWFDGSSIFRRAISETGLRAANPFVISYRRRSRKSFATASFTGSLRKSPPKI